MLGNDTPRKPLSDKDLNKLLIKEDEKLVIVLWIR